jgi:hypothetical protein
MGKVCTSGFGPISCTGPLFPVETLLT